MYHNGAGKKIALGNPLGKGGAATVYLHARNSSLAVKIFKPEILHQEVNLARRIERLNALAKIADTTAIFGTATKSIGAWPKDVVKDVSGSVVGYTMDTVHGGIDLGNIIMARNVQTAFYKYRNSQYYDTWLSSFVYEPRSLRNRFVIAYYLASFFEKMYELKDKSGTPIKLQMCNYDIKPQNVLVYLEEIGNQKFIIPYILDLDNVTLMNDTHMLEPIKKQVTPEYYAREGPTSKYYDFYSIAVIFHQLIFDLHPFMFSNAGGRRFRDGTEFSYFRDNLCYPWGRNRNHLDPMLQNDPKWSNFTRLSPELQKLFLRAFDSDIPTQRPNMSEWKQAFEGFLQKPGLDFKKIFTF
jgi:serine/threonine protein kinase